MLPMDYSRRRWLNQSNHSNAINEHISIIHTNNTNNVPNRRILTGFRYEGNILVAAILLQKLHKNEKLLWILSRTDSLANETGAFHSFSMIFRTASR